MLSVNHAMKVCDCVLNVEMLVLAGPAFCSEDTAAVGVFEIAIREFVVSASLFSVFVIHPQWLMHDSPVALNVVAR